MGWASLRLDERLYHTRGRFGSHQISDGIPSNGVGAFSVLSPMIIVTAENKNEIECSEDMTKAQTYSESIKLIASSNFD